MADREQREDPRGRTGRHLVAVPTAPERPSDPTIEAPTSPERPADDGVRLRHALGDVLREERRRQGRTLADVADEAGVSLPYLSEVERGRKEISSDLLHVVHTALGLELPDVLDRAGHRLRGRAQRRGPFLLAA